MVEYSSLLIWDDSLSGVKRHTRHGCAVVTNAAEQQSAVNRFVFAGTQCSLLTDGTSQAVAFEHDLLQALVTH